MACVRATPADIVFDGEHSKLGFRVGSFETATLSVWCAGESRRCFNEDRPLDSIIETLREVLREEGIVNHPYLCGSAFWIVHHDAIDAAYDLALGFWHKAKEAGLILDVSSALGYAMQILCADPEAHLLTCHPDLWAVDTDGIFRETLPDGRPWILRHSVGTETFEVRPGIVHLPHSKELLVRRREAAR